MGGPTINYKCLDILILCIHVDIQMKFKHAAALYLHIHYMHMHVLGLHNLGKSTWKNPVPCSPSEPKIRPPPWLLFLLLFQNLVAVENKNSGLGIPENKFSGQARAENNLSRPNLHPPTPLRIKWSPLTMRIRIA